jgi:diadenosine tetraphosphate (Ap4A) HIT family hydrolase
MSDKSCPFCTLPQERIIQSNATGIAIYDGFPVSAGHMLIIPHRHMSSFFELTFDEQNGLMELMTAAKQLIETQLNPNGYNIGINDGPAAGQTIPHLHIHLIPRYSGDCKDPRGGVRWVIPTHADYWSIL